MPQPTDKVEEETEKPSKSTPESLAVTDLDKAELPDAQSLADAIKNWQEGDEEQASSDEGVDKPWGDAEKSANKDTKRASSGKRVSRNQARRFARQRALQALYQWDVGKVDLSDVLNQFKETQNLSNVDLDHFERLYRGVALDVDEIDVLLEPALDRPIADLDPIERSILRLSTCELRDCLQTPARVAINEAVELTKRFGADQGHKYVNGVIDKVAMVLRASEMKAGKKS